MSTASLTAGGRDDQAAEAQGDLEVGFIVAEPQIDRPGQHFGHAAVALHAYASPGRRRPRHGHHFWYQVGQRRLHHGMFAERGQYLGYVAQERAVGPTTRTLARAMASSA